MLNRSIESIYNVKSVAPAGLTLDQLKPFQLAILDEKTQKTVASPSDCKNKPFRLVWKSPSKGNGGAFPDKNNVLKPIQSLPITNVDQITKFEAANNDRKVFEAYLGYNGISACKTLKFECGSTYQFVIEVSGKPVRDLLGRDYVEIVPFMTGCCDTCTFEENIKTSLKGIVESINTNAHFIKNFFDVYPVYDCCPAPAPFTKTDFADYCLTICDAGDVSALGDVQQGYQTSNIYLSERNGGLSTYRVDCVPVSTPAAYVQTGTVLSDCDTCPAGYTATNAAKKYIVHIDNAGLGTTTGAWLTEVQAAGAFSAATSAKRISFIDGVSTYEVLIPAASTQPSAPISDTTWTFVADVPKVCTLTSPTTTAWVQCGTRYKIKRTMELVIKNGDCASPGAADLAAITAAYAGGIADTVAGSIDQETLGDCISRYTIDQYSNCLEDGCDWYGKDIAKFQTIPGYKGATWTPIKCEGWTFDVDGCPVAPAAATAEDCRGGLKFVGRNFENDTVDCVDDFWEGAETEGVFLQVSISEFGKNGCERMDVDWTVVQTPTTPQGTGRELLKREIQAREKSAYEYHGANSPNGNLVSARRGEIYSFDVDKLYHTVDVYHNYTRNRTAQNYGTATREVITLAVEADKTALFATVKELANKIADLQGICDYV